MMIIENKSRNTSLNTDDYRKAFQTGMELAEELVSRKNVCVACQYTGEKKREF